MSPRKRIKLPNGIHKDALPVLRNGSIRYDPRGKGRWEIRYWMDGKHKSFKLGDGSMTLKSLHHRAYEWETGVLAENLESLSNEFMRTSEYLDLAPRTQSDYRDCHNAIMRFPTRSGRPFGKAKLSRIKTATVREYRDARKKQAATRAAHEIRYLKRLFAWGMEQELIDSNPAKAIRLKRLESPRTHYVDDTDYLAKLIAAPLKIAVVAHLAYLTGRRRTDILNIRRSDIRKDGLHFTESKTGKSTVVGYSDELSGLLDLAKSESSGFYLFPGSQNGRYSDRAFASAWKRAQDAMTAIGFTKFQFKDIRAKHATDLEMAGEDATDSLVHGSRSTTARHYIRKRRVVPLR